jgi:ABC-type uncharacterized transport system substrate-binding protein
MAWTRAVHFKAASALLMLMVAPVMGLLAFGPAADCSHAEHADQPTVFIVCSYRPENVCGADQELGIRERLSERFGHGIRIETHYMYTKTVNRDARKMAQDAQVALKKIESCNPDLVYTVDDNAFREVGLKLVGRPFPVVFSGMNGQPSLYNSMVQFLDDQGRPSANVTGVYEKLHVKASLNVMKQILPSQRRVVALLDDTPTGAALEVQLLKELEHNNTGVSVDIRRVRDMTEYGEQIDRIERDDFVDAAYNMVLSIEQAPGQFVDYRRTFAEYIRRCTKPSHALNFAFARQGLFGGASCDFAAMGRQAAGMGMKLLDGADIRDLPIENAEAVLLTFNKARADMLGIEIPTDVLGAARVFNEIKLFNTSQ